jgi:uncharacterized protein (TIGR02266 family)
MKSSTDSESSRARAPSSSRPARSSRSRGHSAPAEPSASRLLFEPRRDLAVAIPVEVARRSGDAAREYATNLSPGGICLHARTRLEIGEGVAVAFELPDGGRRVEARGRVTWREDEDPSAQARFQEAGIRFEVIDESDRERILRFVREFEPL